MRSQGRFSGDVIAGSAKVRLFAVGQIHIIRMKTIRHPIDLRWADLDPNFHLRHDVFYAIGAQARIAALRSVGITDQRMQEHAFGPIIFREECVFKREVRMGVGMEIVFQLSKARSDGSRWSFRHEFVRDDGTVCAVLTTDGAWIDMKLRKLTVPPQDLMNAFMELPHSDDFETLPMPAPGATKG